jgi:hypothetical protein
MSNSDKQKNQQHSFWEIQVIAIVVVIIIIIIHQPEELGQIKKCPSYKEIT